MPDALAPMGLEARYSRVAMWFHWVIALLIIGNLTIGGLHDDFGKEAEPAILFWHKSIGLTVLVLSIGRLAWRLGHRPPPFDPLLARWEAAMARAAHALFYVMMIAMPLTGWLVVSTSARATDFFGLISIPPLPVAADHDAHEMWEDVHQWLAYAMIALIVLHVAGALKHHFQGHRHLIGRMGPWLYRGPTA